MKTGLLRDQVTIQRATETLNAFGEVSVSWSTYATVWAEVVDLSGREFWAAQQINSELSIRVRIRYLSGIVPKMRVSVGSRTFDIGAILDPEGRRRELHLMCSELL